MPLLSLILASAVLVGAGSWGADASRSLEFEFSRPGDSNSETSEILSRIPMPFDAAKVRGDGPRRFVINEWTRDFCGPDLKPQSVCLVAGELYEKKKARPFEPGARVSEISDDDKMEQAIVPVPAAAPLLLSALAGLAFASRGRENSREGR